MKIEIIFSDSNIEPTHANLDVNRLCKRTFPHLTVLVFNYTQVEPIKLKNRFVLSSLKSVLNIFDFKMDKMILENRFFYWISH